MEYEKKIFNILFSFGLGISLGFVYALFKRNKLNLKKRNKRDLLIMLYEKKIYSREEIINIGKKALSCPLTNKIFCEPVVSKDGRSYEKIKGREIIRNNGVYPGTTLACNDEINGLYDNRALREFIEIFIMNKGNKIKKVNL